MEALDFFADLNEKHLETHEQSLPSTIVTSASHPAQYGIFTAGEGGVIRLWDFGTGELILAQDSPSESFIFAT